MAIYSLDKRCSVCGARIGDNNILGVGGECLYAYRKARKVVFFKDNNRFFEHRGIE